MNPGQINPEQLPLQDIHLPQAISWWPPAIGWWLLALMSIVLIIAVSCYFRRYLQNYRYRRAALQGVEQALSDYQRSNDCSQLAAALNRLLRQVCAQRYGRENIAAISGQDWENFLLAQCPGLERNKIEQLQAAAYSASTQLEVDASIKWVQTWIRKHRRYMQ